MQAARFATSAARSAPSTVAVAPSRTARASSSSARSLVSARTISSRKGSPDPGAQACSSSLAAIAAPRKGSSEGCGRRPLSALRWSSSAGVERILS